MFQQRQTEVVKIAMRSITSGEKFYPVPTDVAGDVILGYLWNAKREQIPRNIALALLLEKLKFITSALRTRIFMLPELSPVRCAVLLHLSAAVGVDRVLAMADLWAALQRGNYEHAHDIILRIYWAEGIARTELVQNRLLALARMWRTNAIADPSPIQL